jgi:citrate lyase subunit beta/citryl-CoA lyase
MGITPVSFVYQEYKDIETLKEFLVLEKRVGYRAKGVVSPMQAKEVMLFFGFDQARIEKARYIVERFESMQSQGVTGFVDDVYDFIDEPIYKASQALLKEYEIFKKDQ